MAFVVDTYQHLAYITITTSRMASSNMSSTCQTFLRLLHGKDMLVAATININVNNTNATVGIIIV